MSKNKNTIIFDSLTHPTLTGKWISGDFDASFQGLSESFGARCGACAVGLPGVGGYNHEAFYAAALRDPRLVPVAAIESKDKNSLKSEIGLICKIGYRAIKLHPRLSELRLSPDDPFLNEVFSLCVERRLVLFFCTYVSAPIQQMPDFDPLWTLTKLLKRYDNIKCVLLHGGVTRLLQYADLVRFNPNILLDLSFTIMKFSGSSVDLDLRYLFRNLDKRICVGTDHPEISIRQLEIKLKSLTKNLPQEKLENIYRNNLKTMLGIET